MSSLTRGLVAAIVAALLWLPPMSAAQAKGCEKPAVQQQIHNKVWDGLAINRANPKAGAGFRSFPTWPEGEPDYHGNGG